MIVGEGVEDAAITAEISRRGLTPLVQMLGVRRDISRILAASDVFLLSSHREGFPIAVLEAMAAALPVIATAVGDLPSIVEDGVTGRLIAPGDTQAFACAIIDVLNDPKGARLMGRQGRRSVAAFGLEKMIENYEALYAGNVHPGRRPDRHRGVVGQHFSTHGAKSMIAFNARRIPFPLRIARRTSHCNQSWSGPKRAWLAAGSAALILLCAVAPRIGAVVTIRWLHLYFLPVRSRHRTSRRRTTGIRDW